LVAGDAEISKRLGQVTILLECTLLLAFLSGVWPVSLDPPLLLLDRPVQFLMNESDFCGHRHHHRERARHFIPLLSEVWGPGECCADIAPFDSPIHEQRRNNTPC